MEVHWGFLLGLKYVEEKRRKWNWAEGEVDAVPVKVAANFTGISGIEITQKGMKGWALNPNTDQ